MKRLGQLVVGDGCISVPGRGGTSDVSNLEELRELVRTDDGGRYRPLSGATTLPSGWRFPAPDEAAVAAGIDAVYPLALTHGQELQLGQLRVVTLNDVLRRQSGRYEATAALSQKGRVRATAIVCGECVRIPVWNRQPCELAEIPCPEPCSVLVAFCREAALWEAERPERAEPDESVAWAAFEEPGNELREHYLSMLERESE